MDRQHTRKGLYKRGKVFYWNKPPTSNYTKFTNSASYNRSSRQGINVIYRYRIRSNDAVFYGQAPQRLKKRVLHPSCLKNKNILRPIKKTIENKKNRSSKSSE